jgi:hypothetical protein
MPMSGDLMVRCVNIQANSVHIQPKVFTIVRLLHLARACTHKMDLSSVSSA